MLRLYVDTADRAQAEPLLATGLFTGMTTNPTLLQRAGLRLRDLEDVYAWATGAGAQEVFFQAWGDDAATLVECSQRLQDIGSDVVLKLPATTAGTTAAATLVRRGHRVLLTAVYNARQGLLAGAAGAQYVAPYLGRMGDAGRDGMAAVTSMHRALRASGSQTEVLVASLRDVDTVVTLAEEGVRCFALAPAVAQQLFVDELTAQAVEVFDAAAREAAA